MKLEIEDSQDQVRQAGSLLITIGTASDMITGVKGEITLFWGFTSLKTLTKM